MRVLITGGAGFVGSNLADRLLARGNAVLIIDDFTTGRRDNLQEHERLELVEGDIADAPLVADAFGRFRPTHVVHAAAAYKDPDDWERDIHTNVLGTAVVLRAARRSAIERLIYFQTSLCYGLKPREQPIKLTCPIDSRGSSYAISKTSAEQYIDLSGLDFCSFRLANAYGPRNLTGPLPTFYQRLTAGKKCFVMDTRRDFLYIDDLLEVVIKALDGRGRGYYHVASGSDFSIKELFDATVEILGIELDEPVEVRERNPDDAYTILLDPSRTNADFDWRTRTPLLEGARKAIHYYKEYGLEQTFTHLRGIND